MTFVDSMKQSDDQAEGAVSRRRKPKRRTPLNGVTLAILRAMALAVTLGAWELTARLWVDPFWISQPSDVFPRLWDLANSGQLFDDTYTTVQEAFLGLVLGVVVGVAAGLLLARFQTMLRVLDPYIFGLYSLPRVALAPLFIIWFGLGLTSKVMMAFSIVFFIVLIACLDGVKSIDQNLVDMMKTMKASRRTIRRKVLVPSLLPWIMSSVRISVGMALVGAVVGELIGSQAGLGHYVARSSGLFDTTGLFAGLVALIVVAVALNEIVAVIDRRLFKWRPSVDFGRSQ